MQFTVLNRKEHVNTVQQETVDLLIIGGGITGAGVALDAVARGLSVIVVEMQDFSEGTSSRSTKLVHGGLRYLKQFELKEVAALGKERAIVYENAPHVTTPIWMMLPFHKNGTFGALSTSVGLKLYDILAQVQRNERRFMLSAFKTIEREPLIKQEDLLGSGVYVEYQTDDARLTMEVLKAAVNRGAYAFNYMKATALKKQDELFEVTVEDHLYKQAYTFKARKVVNAAGPWVADVLELDGEKSAKHTILSKGVHLVFDSRIFPLQQGVYFDTKDDGRMIFAIPRDGKTYVGTTDTFYEGDPQHLTVSSEDKRYLLDAIHYMFPTVQVSEANIESTWAGVRPLIYEEGKSPSDISRKDEVWQSTSGLITIAGGKLTGYRKMAEKVVDLVAEQLQAEFNKKSRACTTKHLPLSGGDLSGAKYFDTYIQKKKAVGMRLGIDAYTAEKMVRRYGTNIEQVFSFVDKVGKVRPDILAQLHYAIYFESVAKPVDFFVRRTGAMYFDIHLVENLQTTVLTEMQTLLQWDEQQLQAYKAELKEAIQIAKA